MSSCRLFGVLEVTQPLSGMPQDQRFALIQQCVQFCRNSAKTAVSSGLCGCNPSIIQLEQVKSHDLFASQWIPNDAVKVSLLLGDTLQITDNKNQILLQHPRHLIGAVAAPGPGGEFVYVGHESVLGHRLAVVLDMMGVEAAKDTAKLYTKMGSLIRLNSGSSQFNLTLPKRMDQLENDQETHEYDHFYQNDPFYEAIGLLPEDQEKLYDDLDYKESSSNKTSVKSNKIAEHLDKFIDDEEKYYKILGNLIKLRDKSEDSQFRYALKDLNSLKELHEKLYFELKSKKKSISTGVVANMFINYAAEFECYIKYIRVTQSSAKTTLDKYIKSTKEIRDEITSTFKRVIHYMLTLQTWMDSSNLEEQTKLKQAIEILQKQCKIADSVLIVNAVKNCPYALFMHCPLIRHTIFTVEGTGFKKNVNYQVLLFETLLVFCESSTKGLTCFEALNLEKVVIVTNELKKKDSAYRLRLEVNHGPRRGVEVITVYRPKKYVISQWKEDIYNILAENAKKIKMSYNTIPTL